MTFVCVLVQAQCNFNSIHQPELHPEGTVQYMLKKTCVCIALPYAQQEMEQNRTEQNIAAFCKIHPPLSRPDCLSFHATSFFTRMVALNLSSMPWYLFRRSGVVRGVE